MDETIKTLGALVLERLFTLFKIVREQHFDNIIMDIQAKVRLQMQLHDLVNASWDQYGTNTDNGLSSNHPVQVALHERIMTMNSKSRAIDNMMECIVDSVPYSDKYVLHRKVMTRINKMYADVERATRFDQRVAFVIKDCLHCHAFNDVYASKRCQSPPICKTFD